VDFNMLQSYERSEPQYCSEKIRRRVAQLVQRAGSEPLHLLKPSKHTHARARQILIHSQAKLSIDFGARSHSETLLSGTAVVVKAEQVKLSKAAVPKSSTTATVLGSAVTTIKDTFVHLLTTLGIHSRIGHCRQVFVACLASQILNSGSSLPMISETLMELYGQYGQDSVG